MTDAPDPDREETSRPEPSLPEGTAPAPSGTTAPATPGDRLQDLRDRVRPALDELQHLRAALERAVADEQRADREVSSAREALSDAEQTHARVLAASYREEGQDSTTALDAAAAELGRARDRLRSAEADREQASRAVELLRADVRRAQEELDRAATQAKRETAEAILVDLRDRWARVQALVQELVAIAALPHGEDPPVLQAARQGAAAFEARVLERGVDSRPHAPGRAARAAGVATRVVLTVVGAVGTILGSFLEWFPPRAVSGMELDYRVYYDPAGLESLAPNSLLAGTVTIVLGGLALVGLAFRSGWVTRIAGAIGVVAVVLVAVTMVRGPGPASFPGSVGLGLWTVLLGAVVALVAGFLGSRRRRS